MNEPYSVLTDAELLCEWAQGNPRAGRTLYGRYFDIVYRFFRFKTPDAVEDLTQITMEALSRSQGRFRGEKCTFRAFVLGIARNKLLHYLRGRYRNRIDLNPLEYSQRDLNPSPFDVVATRHLCKVLVKSLRRIPIDHQILLELHYWEGLSSAEIGTVLEVKASTVRYRLEKARKVLRKTLETVALDPADIETTMSGLRRWASELRELALGSPSSELFIAESIS